MPPQDPTPSQEPKDSLPPSSLEWKIASALLVEISSEGFALRSLRFQELFQTLRPWMEKAVNSLCRRHALLLDSSAISFSLVQALVNAPDSSLKRSASSEVLLQIYLESAALNACKAEQASFSKLGAETGTWDQFRNQFHQLEREERKAVLKALPQITVAQDKDATPTIPDQDWLTLWSRVTRNIEHDALPLEWQRYLEAPPTSVYEKSIDCPTIWIPGKSNEFEQKLGKELFKASVWTAKEREDKVCLVLPKWMGESSRQNTRKNLLQLLRQNGGALEDPKFQSLIESLVSPNSPTETLPTVGELLVSSGDLGFSKFWLEILHSAHSIERDDQPGATMALQRAISTAQSRKDLSNAYSALGAFNIVSGNLDEATSLLVEALRLHPWSGIAQRNLKRARKLPNDGREAESNG